MKSHENQPTFALVFGGSISMACWALIIMAGMAAL